MESGQKTQPSLIDLLSGVIYMLTSVSPSHTITLITYITYITYIT